MCITDAHMIIRQFDHDQFLDPSLNMADWRRRTKGDADRATAVVEWSCAGRQVKLEQGTVSNALDLGRTVWDGCLILTAYFDHQPNALTDWSAKTFVELGAGTGLLSIYAALRGGRRVVATDRNHRAVLELLRRNLDANGCAQVEVVDHLWGSPPSDSLGGPFDVVMVR